MRGNLLRDKKPMRAMKGFVNQLEMFQLVGKFNPQTEGIATVKQVDDALNVSKIYKAVIGTMWVRTAQYVVYKRDPKEPLGKEVIWVEKGARHVHEVPDVPVQFGGKEISLQKVTGMAVYDSISLLKIESTDMGSHIVSVVDPATLEGKVRVIDFMRNGWALTDEYGFPLASQPASSSNPAARRGCVRFDYPEDANGWHGSVARSLCERDVLAAGDWCQLSKVAIVGRFPGVIDSQVPPNLVREEERLIVEGTPAQLDAVVRLIQNFFFQDSSRFKQ